MFDLDDPTKTAEDKMSDALVWGCVVVTAIILGTIGLVATIVKVWL